MRYEVFLSYSRKDNTAGWVTAIRDHILTDHRRFSTEPLRIFFDEKEIKDMDDWRHRILGALRSSKVLLVCLSPNYFASEYCLWEWKEYVTHQVHQLMGSDSVAGVYFVEVPGSIEQNNAAEFNRWVQGIKPFFDDITRSNYTDIRPWFPEGAEALQKDEVRRRMTVLGESLWERLQRARRAEAAPGNLRRQSPFFVGRREELRRLHEFLGTGVVGVVTAVYGLGGQGKTELAVAYAHGWADCYRAGLWAIDAEGQKELLPTIGKLAFNSKFTDDRNFPFSPTEAQRNNPVELGQAVLMHLQKRAIAICDSDSAKGAAALLLLDNVSEAELLSPAQLSGLPSHADWLRIVATTRLGPETLHAHQRQLALVAVDSMDEDTAFTLLRDHQPPRNAKGEIVVDPEMGVPAFTSPIEDDTAREIVRTLGCFTLAVEQVAVFLGLYPEITPSAFLSGLRRKGLPSADHLVESHPEVAAQMLTQSKQLALILEATLARLDVSAHTALEFAALLPPHTVAWPWLKVLTTARHPELIVHDRDQPDPWLKICRRLTGLRLLTSGDDSELACLHRLVAAHLQKRNPPFRSGVSDQVLKSQAAVELEQYAAQRARAIYETHSTPQQWELDVLIAVLSGHLAAPHGMASQDVAMAALLFTEKVRAYRSLPRVFSLLQSADKILEQHAAADRSNIAWQQDLIISKLWLGDMLVRQGALATALWAYRASHAAAQRLAAADLSDTHRARDLFISQSAIANVLATQGDWTAAIEAYQEVLKVNKRLAALDSFNLNWQHDLSVSHGNLGEALHKCGNLVGARYEFQASFGIQQRLAATDPSNVEWQYGLSAGHSRLGDLLMDQGDLAGAVREYRASLGIRKGIASNDLSNRHWQYGLSLAHERLGNLLRRQKDSDAALLEYQAALDITKQLVESDPTNTVWQRALSVHHGLVGIVLETQKNLAGAQTEFQQVLAIQQKLVVADPSNAGWQRDVIVTHTRLGDICHVQGDRDGALRYFGSARKLAVALSARQPENPDFRLLPFEIRSKMISAYSSAPHIRLGIAAAIPALAYSAWRIALVSPWLWPVSAIMALPVLATLIVLILKRFQKPSPYGRWENVSKLSSIAAAVAKPETIPNNDSNCVAFQQRADYFVGKEDYIQAEKMLRRALEGFLQTSQSRSGPSPELDLVLAKYKNLLEKMGHSPQEMMDQLNSIGKPFGVQFRRGS